MHASLLRLPQPFVRIYKPYASHAAISITHTVIFLPPPIPRRPVRLAAAVDLTVKFLFPGTADQAVFSSSYSSVTYRCYFRARLLDPIRHLAVVSSGPDAAQLWSHLAVIISG